MVTGLVALLLCSGALAQDMDELPEADLPEFEDAANEDAQESDPLSEEGPLDSDTPEPGPAVPVPSQDTDAGFDEDDDIDFFDDESGEDLLGDDAPENRSEGSDTASDFRDTKAMLDSLSADERLQGWEDYLGRFPSSNFLEQISREIVAAESEMYGEGIGSEITQRVGHRGVKLPEMVQTENLNPATRLRAGFEFGLPDWLNLMADFEYALMDNLSVHGGMRKRISGWSLDMGPRYALVKDDNLGLLVTVMADFHFNVDPGYYGVRPGAGAAYRVMDKLWLQAQGNVELEVIEGYAASRYQASGAAHFRANDAVALYVEGAYNSKFLNWPGGNFRFHTTTFGMRFYPGAKRDDWNGSSEVVLGGTVPVSYQFWDRHLGAATVQTLTYFE